MTFLHPLSADSPTYLYKIVSPDDWNKSLEGQKVVKGSIDTDFIHLAKQDQVKAVAEKFWKEKAYILLKLETAKLKGRLVYETNPGGSTKYYHLYNGYIPIEAVVEKTASSIMAL